MSGKRPLAIYHGNCADGFGAAWVFHHVFKGQFDFHAGVYSDKNLPDVDDREVYLLDFSYKRDVVLEIVKRATRVFLIDHHKTALEDLQGLILDRTIDGRFSSLDHSGAMLAWKYATRGRPDAVPPPLLRIIEDRDLWRFRLPNTREISAALFSYPYDFQVWDELMLQNDLSGMVSDGIALERKHFKDINELLVKTRRVLNISGYRVPAANLPYTMSSDAGHILAEGHPFAACYTDGPDGVHFSLRSAKDGIDVSEIAKKYGGGGHKAASGFKVSYAVAATFELEG